MEPDWLTLQEITEGMDGVLRPHPEEGDRRQAFLPSPMVQNHAAYLAWLPDGTLACTWFGGTMEGKSDISVWLSRLAPGADRWSAAERLSDAPDRSEQNPVLWTAPDGTVRLFHTSQPGGRQDEAEIMTRVSRDGGQSFRPTHRLGRTRGVFIRQPPLLGPGGEWILPGFRCVTPDQGRWTGDRDVAVLLVSRDGGETWAEVEVPDSLGAVHMNPVAPRGGVIPAFFRDRFARAVLRSTSNDGGLSWTAPQATNLPNNNSSVQALRLSDGRIAIVMNPVNAALSDQRRASLYDEIEGEDAPTASAAIWGVPRAPLSLAISADGGVSFTRLRDLETGSGHCLTNNSAEGLNREFSYPSILQGPDGALHIAYTCYRRAIRHLRLEPLP